MKDPPVGRDWVAHVRNCRQSWRERCKKVAARKFGERMSAEKHAHETRQEFYLVEVGEDCYRKYHAVHYRVRCLVCGQLIVDTADARRYRPGMIVTSKSRDEEEYVYALSLN